jgi:SRSO17 transposase
VLATSASVQTKLNGKLGPIERLVVIKTIGPKPEIKYVLTNAESSVAIGEVVCAAAVRHSIEESFLTGKGESGLKHYEVRSWIGWHHHITLSLIAGWFLVLECQRQKKTLPR